MSLNEIHEEIELFEEKIRRRNFIGYAACLIVLAGFAFNLFVFPNLIQRIGSLLSITAAGYLIYQLRLSLAKKTAVKAVCVMGIAASIEFYRTELQHQRDFYSGIGFWSRLLILFPGPLVFLIGSEIAHPELTRPIRLEMVALIVLAVLAIPVNLRLAHRYQRQINELDSLQY
jgi:hypothetical protein